MNQRFATMLRVIRESRGMSQATLARLTDLDSGYLTRCEQGTRVPATLDVIERLIGALRCSDAEANALRVAAGFLPPAVARVGPADPEIVTLARLLDPTVFSEATRQSVRSVVRGLGELLLDRAEAADQSGVGEARDAPDPGEPAVQTEVVADSARRRQRRSKASRLAEGG